MIDMVLKTRTLFIKIFLWFWLVTALTGIILYAFAVIGDSARNRVVQRQRAEERRQRMEETLSFFGETTIKLISLEGPRALNIYSDKLARTTGIHPYFFLPGDQTGFNADAPPEVLELAKRARQSGKMEYSAHDNEFMLAKPLQSASGSRYIVVGKTQLDSEGGASPATRKPPPEAMEACRGMRLGDACSIPAQHGKVMGQCEEIADMPPACIPDMPVDADVLHQTPDSPPNHPASHHERHVIFGTTQFTGSKDPYSKDLGKYLVIIFIIGGIACYLLTWYLTAPLRRLRMVAQKLADGDLSARVDRNLNRRGDEIADLGGDLNRMAERIEGLIESQQRLLRDISHELRSPLARLNVALELVRQSPEADSAVFLDRIERESTRLNELIGQLLTLTKLENDNNRVKMEIVELGELLEEIAGDMDFEAVSTNRKVTVMNREPVNIIGNTELLRQTIENIVRNAIRYTKENTAVELSLVIKKHHGKTWANVMIRDYGTGVPENELVNIFKPFYRVSDGRERESGGVGVGLAISERAVRIHGGKIEAFNANGGGLIVSIELPML